MVTRYVRRAAARAVDLVLPPRCAICGAEGTFLCGDCLDELADLGEPPAAGSSSVEIRSRWAMEGLARQLVHQLKYRGFKALARPLGAELGRLVRRSRVPADLVTYVPLHRSGLRRRGYDQARSLAAAVAFDLELPLVNSLVRSKVGGSQVGARNRKERVLNVAGVFEPAGPSLVNRRDVLIVDDVTTTGATLASAGEVLKDSGALRVSAVTVTRET